MFAPKRTKPRTEIQIFEQAAGRAFESEKGPGWTAGALILIQLALVGR